MYIHKLLTNLWDSCLSILRTLGSFSFPFLRMLTNQCSGGVYTHMINLLLLFKFMLDENNNGDRAYDGTYLMFLFIR